ncbi:uncharacterized protein LOC133815494 [Humulus lupulus]|uniref:uncharacterized protein LOC133815494 n=1 Tax=Humulus lupulus TaxID=3486 RepID=UPI002B40BFD6|nr:uncharacterized protein LOC133815494 [Humulus lupulus]
MDNCNVASWNVRGVNNKNKQDSVLEFCSLNKIGVGALLETKLKDNKIKGMMMNKFSSWDYYNSPTIEGRLLIIWRKSFVRVIVIAESSQFVHCYVKMSGQEEAFYVTFVYGLNTNDERKSLCVDLLSLRFPMKPWLLLEDFNAVFNIEDRSGGNPISINDLTDATLWKAQVHVEALKRSGTNFTWSNNQDGTSRIYSRIDHAFANEDWHDVFPNTIAHFAWESISNHCSCVVVATVSEKIGFKPFRYYNFWAEHPEFKELVTASWEKPLAVIGLKGIYYKLMRLKHSLKRFNNATIGDVGKAYFEAKANFIDARQQAQAHSRDIAYQDMEKTAAEILSSKEKMYFSFLRQRSKVKWLQQGDENTSYFHAYLKKRKVENRIATFVTDQGAVNDKFTEVVDHFLNHFHGYMGSRNTTTMRLNVECLEKGTRLNLEQQLDLLKPFSNKEIKKVLFNIPDVKYPGPDGYGSGFFKSMWPVLGAEVCRVISDFFNTGSMPSEFHATMISLIPKKDKPSRAVDYRPIACCSTIYKCISKLMYLRLVGVLPSLVNQNQGAFIKGRSIAHNVMILQDLLKNYKRKTVSPRCAIKIDISKAYDTVNWDFLEALLNAFNLPEKFVQRVMICLRSTTYSITMNGRVQGSFEDDLILSCKGSRQSMLVIKEVLDVFRKTTGLHISEDKSQVYFGGVNSSEKSAILSDLHLTEGVFPLKYLGVPLRPTKWKAEDCGIIIKKINQRLHSWASRHLSFAGRIQLIHSVLFGLRNYWMSIFVLPHSVTRVVEKLCRGFLWGVNGNRSKIHVASWEKERVTCFGSNGSIPFILKVPLSGLIILNQTRVGTSICYYYKVVWNTLNLPKHRFMLWQVVNSQVLTRDNMVKFHLDLDSLDCPVCGDSYENHEHLFFRCSLSRRVVDQIFDWLGMSDWPKDYNGWTSWLNLKMAGMVHCINVAVLAAISYCIVLFGGASFLGALRELEGVFVQ